MKIILFSFIVGCMHLTAYSQWGKPARYGKPMISDVSSTMCKVELGMGKNEKEYDLTRGEHQPQKLFLEANLGVSFPVWSREMKNGNGISFSIPVHTQILFDFLESSTSPIVNTDYNFALIEARYIKRFQGENLKNVVIKFSPYYHQSSHLGDELVLYRKEQDFAVRRVNVTYDYADLALSVNDPDGATGKSSSLKIGAMVLIKPDSGWYSSVRPVESDVVLQKMKSPWEFYLQYQLVPGKYFLSGDRFQHILSLEIRNRERYGIPRQFYQSGSWELREQESARSTTVNFYSVWYFKIADGESHNRLGLGLRYYRGLNYHGQLRHLPDYDFYSLSLVLE